MRDQQANRGNKNTTNIQYLFSIQITSYASSTPFEIALLNIELSILGLHNSFFSRRSFSKIFRVQILEIPVHFIGICYAVFVMRCILMTAVALMVFAAKGRFAGFHAFPYTLPGNVKIGAKVCDMVPQRWS